MKASRFSEEQIIAILRDQEAGQKTVDVCRRHGISEATFYKWKSKYGGLEVSDAKRLQALSAERRRLGYRRLHVMLSREGLHMNHKKLRRRKVFRCAAGAAVSGPWAHGLPFSCPRGRTNAGRWTLCRTR